VILTGEVKQNSTLNIDNSAQNIRKYNDQVNRNITTYESETESPIEKSTQSTHFGFEAISIFEVDDCDYEADDSSHTPFQKVSQFLTVLIVSCNFRNIFVRGK
jgi:hypothetical protein